MNETKTSNPSNSFIKKITKSGMFGSVLIVLVLLAIMLILKPNYLSGKNIYTIARVVTITAMVGFSQMLIIGCGGLNLSIGSTGALAAVIAGWAMTVAGLPIGVAIVMGIAVGALCGIINGLLIYRAGGVGVAYFLTTLATSSVFQGVCLTITSGNPYYGPDGKYAESFLNIGNTHILGLPSSFFIMLVIAAFLIFLYVKMPIGRQFLAFGANYKAAELYGVSKFKVVFFANLIAGIIAAITGLLTLIRIEAAQPNMGADWMLMSFAATLIGGTRNEGGKINVIGTIFGALALTIITNALVHLKMDAYWKELIYGLVLLFAVTIDRVRYIKK